MVSSVMVNSQKVAASVVEFLEDECRTAGWSDEKIESIQGIISNYAPFHFYDNLDFSGLAVYSSCVWLGKG